MKNIYYLLTIGILLLSSSIMAQNANNFAFYRNQMTIINPAYAGVDNQTVAALSFRTQWTGIEDSPRSQAGFLATPIAKNLGFGVSVFNEKTFVEKQTSIAIDLSYLVKLNEETNLYFGIKAGGNSFVVNTSGLELYSVGVDPAFGSVKSSFTPNVGVGALLKNEKYFLSISAPKLISFKDVKNVDGYALVSTNRPQLYASAGYDFNLNPSGTLILKPSFMARFITAAPVSVDINTMLSINDIFEVGGLYRTTGAVAAMASVTVSKKLCIGFAYEITTKAELASAKNTNEFLLQYKF
ncbi:type IX secretion system membrane protein PorP/SprF [Flavobacterium sp. 5]|uniref:PorP/SprF family type IX secretion system membrane protein n=1 Tax=Flavobacterium sp. 5 TaxID=2035199 RepID=UPI000C2C674E|nr:type IX secretion system membrane protein PorP/SprF [Flavobacterium sp. 5]PKB15169.1 type IX secretion system PorP/SprF family membrane protein [Flavobacterium sp. 5]